MKTDVLPVLDGVEILGEIGKGSHSVVHLAQKDGERLALKLLREAGSAADFLQFRREAAMLACMQHPALPTILEVGEVGGRPWLLMDLAEGPTLARVIAESGRLPIERIVALGKELAGALDEVHRRGFVHRDVKPENVVILPDGHVRLLDFGLAARIRSEGVAETATGTFLYSAPEQTGMLKRVVDSRADLYGLGALLFECCAARPPFLAREVGELIRLHAAMPPPDLTVLREDIPRTLARIIARLLAKDPDDRYQSAGGLLADLERLPDLESQGTQAILGIYDGAPVKFETPLVGRELEKELLKDCWTATGEGQGGAVLIEGMAGYGKSRLLRELASEIRGDDVLILKARCLKGDAAPLGPLREAIEGWVRRIRQLPSGPRREQEQRLVRAVGEYGPLLKRFSPALATLLPDVEEAPVDGGAQDPFFHAVSRFLVNLAGTYKTALFAVDDVELLDEASRQVLRRLVPMVSATHLLIVAAGGSGAEGLARFIQDTGEHLALRLPLGKLKRDEIRGLIRHQLGGVEPDAQLVDTVALRSEGAPFAVIETVAAMLDAGLMVPHWGTWQIDMEGVTRLDLPSDVQELIARRVDGLSTEVRSILSAAAVWGTRFPAGALSRLAAVAPDRAAHAVEEALRAHLIEPAESGSFAFVHERVREAILSEVLPATLRQLHRQAAAWVREGGDGGPASVYALARHLHLGAADASAVYDANLEAGRLALDNYANTEASAFLEAARKAAREAGMREEALLGEALATAAERAGRFDEAAAHLRSVLPAVEDRLDRGRIHARLAEIHLGGLDTGAAWKEIETGFAEVGAVYPKGNLWSCFLALALATLGTLSGLSGVGAGGARGRARRRHQVLARLSNLGARLGYLDGRLLLMAQMTLIPLFSIHRLGPGREMIGAYAAQNRLLSFLRLGRLAEALGNLAEKVAERLPNRKAMVGHVRLSRAVGRSLRGETLDAERLHRANLVEHGHWMEAGLFLTGIGDLVFNLLSRGHDEEAWSWSAEGLRRSEQAGQAREGREPEGRDSDGEEGHPLRAVFAGGSGSEIWNRSLEIQHRILSLIEKRELGAALDEALDAHGALPLQPRSAPHQLKLFWVYQAMARHEQLLQGGSRATYEEAVAQLKRAATTPVLEAHWSIHKACLLALDGDLPAATRFLLKAEEIARRHDAPWITFEAWRARARFLLQEGKREEALREAKLAQGLGFMEGWTARVRSISLEFDLAPPRAMGREANSHGEGGNTAAQLKLERQLAALLQVNRATASVLHPDRVAELALDEIVRILGAERAILFLQSDQGQLEKKAIRGSAALAADGETYSRTAVERAWHTRHPVVVSNQMDEVELGSRSVVDHDLRSLMAVPLLTRDRIVGVVYVDSRQARGLFSHDDLQILKALAGYIANAIETAHAMQLELQRKALERDLERAFEQATTDALTGLRNRRFLEERMVEELERSRRTGRPLSLLILDVDRFKRVNDVHGHQTGDRVLQAVAEAIATSTRTIDVAVRYGGEEFCVLAPDTDGPGAMVLADRIREAIACRSVDLDGGGELRVTASLGVSEYRINGADAKSLFAAADRALYDAKEGGRNRVVLAARGTAAA